MVEAVAGGLGLLVRILLQTAMIAFRLAGPMMVVYGIQLIYMPAAWVVAGLFILGMQHRPTRAKVKNERH